MASVIEEQLLNALRELLAQQGDVDNLLQIPANADNPQPMVLVTMKSPLDAIALQQRFGFSAFGYSSVIVSAGWISRQWPATAGS